MGNTGIFTNQDISFLRSEGQWSGDLASYFLIQSQTVSGTSTTYITFSDLQTDKYNLHLFVLSNLQSAPSFGGQIHYHWGEDGTLDTNAHYQSALQRCNTTGFSEFRQHNVAYPYIQGTPLASSVNRASNIMWYFSDIGNKDREIYAWGQCTSSVSTNQYVSEFGGNCYIDEHAVDSVQWGIANGGRNFQDGTNISLYGIRSTIE